MKEILSKHKKLISQISQKDISDKIVANALFFVGSVITQYNRIKIDNGIGKPRYANFFGVTFAGSGSGKDLSLNTISDIAIENDGYLAGVMASFNQLNGPLPTGEEIEKAAYIVPKQYKVALQGTKEGMMRVSNFYDMTDVGSLNVVSTEIGHQLSGSDTLSTLSILWQDGISDGATTVNEKYNPVFDVPTNIMLFGSPSPFMRDTIKHKTLVDSIESALARRSFFVWEESEDINLIDEKYDKGLLNDLSEYWNQVRMFARTKRSQSIKISDDAIELINEYRKKLIDEYNDKKTDWNRIRTSNIDKIERLSGIISILGMEPEVSRQSMQYAIEMSELSDKSMLKVLAPEHEYKKMYKLLDLHGKMTITEMKDMGVELRTKTDQEYNISMLEEYAYRFNKKLEKRGKHSLVLVDYEQTDLNKIIVSIETDPKAKDPKFQVKYQPVSVPFFGSKGKRVIEQLVVNDKIRSFTTAHFSPKKDGEPGHRSADNLIKGQNLIAFDIDSSMSIEEAMSRLSDYTYMIYTTKSHRKEKNGFIADRFRILLPTKTVYYMEPEDHKKLYENLEVVLGITDNDEQTRNVSRMWYTNPEAEVFINKGALLDIRCCLPETNSGERVVASMTQLEIPGDEDEVGRRIYGMQKFVLTNAIEGERNITLFKYAKFLIDIGVDPTDKVREINQMIASPLRDSEVNTIINSALRGNR